MTEIIELFAEELTLLKEIQKYGKEHSQSELERIDRVKLLLLYRIYSNLLFITAINYSDFENWKDFIFSVTESEST